MLSISSQQAAQFQVRQNEDWVTRHVVALTDLAPDISAMYEPDDFRALVIRMLTRADRQGLREQDATVAFCYASIQLGVGFEDDAAHGWFAEALQGAPADWADNIWDGLSAALAHEEAEAT